MLPDNLGVRCKSDLLSTWTRHQVRGQTHGLTTGGALTPATKPLAYLLVSSFTRRFQHIIHDDMDAYMQQFVVPIY